VQIVYLHEAGKKKKGKKLKVHYGFNTAVGPHQTFPRPLAPAAAEHVIRFQAEGRRFENLWQWQCAQR
jgi:hypothetical protein